MCRFLMIKSQAAFQPKEIMSSFARMAQKSRAYDGDWQGDGWGIGWPEKGAFWRLKKSVQPIWTEQDTFSKVPESSLFLVHARSSSFPEHKNNLSYNQPFSEGRYAFLFNGMIRGVGLPFSVPGEIGSHKIWNVLLRLIEKKTPESALSRLKELLLKHSRCIQALNLGLSDGRKMYSLCYYEKHPEYYHLHIFDSRKLKMISSEPLEGYDFRPVDPERSVVF